MEVAFSPDDIITLLGDRALSATELFVSRIRSECEVWQVKALLDGWTPPDGWVHRRSRGSFDRAVFESVNAGLLEVTVDWKLRRVR